MDLTLTIYELQPAPIICVDLVSNNHVMS